MMEILNKGHILGGKGASMIDTTKFIEVFDGIYYEVSTGLPWTSLVYGSMHRRKNDFLTPITSKVYGYLQVRDNNGVLKRWHRVVYEHFIGKIPKGMLVDHKFNNKNDNRIDNLQLISNTNNVRKCKKNRKNTSGFAGVSLYKKTGKYAAYITINQIKNHLGYFDTPEEAYKAYIDAKVKNHGAESILPLKGI